MWNFRVKAGRRGLRSWGAPLLVVGWETVGGWIRDNGISRVPISLVLLLSFTVVSASKRQGSFIYIDSWSLLLHGEIIGMLQAYPSDHSVGDAKNEIHSLLRRFKNLQ